MGKYAGYITPENCEEKISAWQSAIRARVSPRTSLQLKHGKCALLVIDMLNYFCCENGRAYIPSSPTVTNNIARILNFWRAKKLPVFFTRHCHKGEHDLGMLGKFWSDYISCTEEQSHIISLLTPVEGETVLLKNTYDAFINTSLQIELEKAEIEQVLITGVMTNLCCETTARSAFCRGFEVYFVGDATATANETLHFNSLLSVATGFGKVLSTTEVLDERN